MAAVGAARLRELPVDAALEPGTTLAAVGEPGDEADALTTAIVDCRVEDEVTTTALL